MSTMYCNLCKRAVEAKRNIGLGTLLLVLLTGGFWILAIPFYSKRCAICKSDALGGGPTAGAAAPPNWLFVVGALAVIGVVGIVVKTSKQETPSSLAAAIQSKRSIGERRFTDETCISLGKFAETANMNMKKLGENADWAIEANKLIWAWSRSNGAPDIFDHDTIKSVRTIIGNSYLADALPNETRDSVVEGCHHWLTGPSSEIPLPGKAVTRKIHCGAEGNIAENYAEDRDAGISLEKSISNNLWTSDNYRNLGINHPVEYLRLLDFDKTHNDIAKEVYSAPLRKLKPEAINNRFYDLCWRTPVVKPKTSKQETPSSLAAATQSTQSPAEVLSRNAVPLQAPITLRLPKQALGKSCKTSPLEVFPLGERVESKVLTKLTHENCPGARFLSGEIEVLYQGQRYFIKTKKLNSTDPVFYDIQSIRGEGK